MSRVVLSSAFRFQFDLEFGETNVNTQSGDLSQAYTGKILIVDDEREICAMVAEILRDEGHKVSLAHDGQAALKMLSREMPEVCLLDVWLPDIDGLSVLEK
ncbi:MAG: hypothetical protein RI953_2257, partial [Pseudomonadota bacterium]